MTNRIEDTVFFSKGEKEEKNEAQIILETVYQALTEKGYDPINQLVGYLLSGEPAYITGHNNARSIIRRLERDELLEEMVRYYVQNCCRK